MKYRSDDIRLDFDITGATPVEAYAASVVAPIMGSIVFRSSRYKLDSESDEVINLVILDNYSDVTYAQKKKDPTMKLLGAIFELYNDSESKLRTVSLKQSIKVVDPNHSSLGNTSTLKDYSKKDFMVNQKHINDYMKNKYGENDSHYMSTQMISRYMRDLINNNYVKVVSKKDERNKNITITQRGILRAIKQESIG